MGAGRDTLSGGDGFDCAEYKTATSNLTITLGDGKTAGSAKGGTDVGTDSLVSIEEACGGSGNDTITGRTDTATQLEGGDGKDTLKGGGFNDTLDGGTGDDTLNGGKGNDQIDGGAGTDTADYSSSSNPITADLTTRSATGDGTDTLNGIENLTGSSKADTLSGDTNNNTLNGGAGADTLNGGAGNDNLIGGDGTDTLNGGVGADTLYAGNGDDTVYAGTGDDLIVGGDGAGNDRYDGGTGLDTVKYTSAKAAITVDLSTANGSASSTAGNDAAGIGTDVLTNIENVIAGNYNDIITGSSANNILDGQTGADKLKGLGGADTFLFSTKPSFGLSTADHIIDFLGSQDTITLRDKIQINKAAFGIAANATVSLQTITNSSGLTGALASTNLFVYDQSNGNLYWNQNGTSASFGTGGIFAVLDNKAPLSSTNISLV